MFLSIIIPVYKVEPYLRECLDSVAASPLDCWEAILIDDGSPDRCPQICDEYAARDSRFRVIHQENAGVAAARNAGIDVARGEWIWFVDSDDVVDMRPVTGMVEWLKKHQETDLAMFDLETFKDGELISVSTDAIVPVVRDEMLAKNEILLRHVCFHHPRLWYRRRWMEHHQRSLRFTRGIRLAEDLEFQYKFLMLCHRPVKFDTVLYYYRVREGSATQDSAYRVKAVEDLQIVLNNLVRWIREYDIKPEPWLDLRIMKLFQNLLYSASVMNGIDIQKRVREITVDYRSLGFPFVSKMKYRLAKWNIKMYNILNRLYLKLSCVNNAN